MQSHSPGALPNARMCSLVAACKSEQACVSEDSASGPSAVL